MFDLFSSDNKGLLFVLYVSDGIRFFYFDLTCLSSSMRNFENLCNVVYDYFDCPNSNYLTDFDVYPITFHLSLDDFRRFPFTLGYFRGKCTRNLLHSGSL